MEYNERMISLVVFIFGLAIGSFLNVVIYRLEKGESALRGRSYCPKCNHPLAWQDLIPLLSFLLLRGKCRYCSKRISWQYPLVEFVTGALFLVIFWLGVPLTEVLYLWAVFSAFVVIFVYDAKHRLIPDQILYSAILASSIWYLVFSELPKYQILNTLYSALGAAAFFLAIYLVSKGRWMGFGDVKLAFLLGLFLGWPSILVALFFAFCSGAISGVVLIALGKKGLKSEVPFAPFLILGTVIAFFFGSSLISWYFGLFLI